VACQFITNVNTFHPTINYISHNCNTVIQVTNNANVAFPPVEKPKNETKTVQNILSFHTKGKVTVHPTTSHEDKEGE
jgi:hypothetical protein